MLELKRYRLGSPYGVCVSVSLAPHMVVVSFNVFSVGVMVITRSLSRAG